MTIEVLEAEWLDPGVELSAAELAESSGLSEAEVLELVDYGVLVPMDTQSARRTFGGQCVVIVRTACRLRDEFDLDTSAVALAIGLFDRIRGLEGELHELRLLLGRREAGIRP